MNVAEGNGMFARGETYADRVDTGAWSRRGLFLRKLARARRLVTRGLAPDAQAGHRIFIATDALTMRDLLLTLPNAVTRRKEFPPPGAGRFYCDYPTPEYTDRDAVVDQIADMFLLARCQALIHNFSVFNLYAQVVTDSFGGRVCQFERLFARHWVRTVRGIAARQLTRLTRARP